MGKGWAKGLTAATDPRVARAAAAHRGKIYQRRTPFEECRWPNAGRTTLPLEWSDEMAYIVGLTATDGCLYTGRRKINFKSEDRQLVETYLSTLGRTNRVKQERTRADGVVYFTEFHDSRLYEWFRCVGLTPRKSLTLGAIDVPDANLAPLARGLMDGDGGIANFVHAPTLATYPDYRYERFIVSFNSASRLHLEWLRVRLEKLIGVPGSLNPQRAEGRRDMFRLQYGKYASIELLQRFYADPDAPRLMRKWRIWSTYVERHQNA
ncbi:MAG TPA: LAGLIDADG family homing endonuclease [Candidatus Limnocylindria bacterium]